MKRKVISIAILVTVVLLCFVLFRSKGRLQSQKTSTLAAELPPSNSLPTAIPEISSDHLKKTQISLDKIAGASVQEIHDLLASLSAREITELARQLQSLTPGGLSNAKISLFFRAWSQRDPQSALKAALAFKTGWAKETALQAVFDGTDALGAKSLLQSLDQLAPAELSTLVKQSLFAKGVVKLSESDGMAAASLLDSSGIPGIPILSWHQVGNNWAAVDPKSALDWATRQDASSPRRRAAMQGVINGWWQADPDGATKYAEQASNSTFEDQKLAGIIASRMAMTNPARAADWLANLQNSTARELGRMPLAVAWAAKDPEGASRWAVALPTDAMLEVAPMIVATWARNDPQGALRWVSSMTGKVRDDSMAFYAAAVGPVDPASALQWALAIFDPALREQAAGRAAQSWLTQDPQAATNWIQNTNLSPSDKAKLLGYPP